MEEDRIYIYGIYIYLYLCVCMHISKFLRAFFSKVIWVRKCPSLGCKTGRSILNLVFNRERKTNLLRSHSLYYAFKTQNSVQKLKLSVLLCQRGSGDCQPSLGFPSLVPVYGSMLPGSLILLRYSFAGTLWSLQDNMPW